MNTIWLVEIYESDEWVPLPENNYNTRADARREMKRLRQRGIKDRMRPMRYIRAAIDGRE